MSVAVALMRFCSYGHCVISGSWQISTELALSRPSPATLGCQPFRERASCSVEFFAASN
jgi:hypothetical protein